MHRFVHGQATGGSYDSKVPNGIMMLRKCTIQWQNGVSCVFCFDRDHVHVLSDLARCCV